MPTKPWTRRRGASVVGRGRGKADGAGKPSLYDSLSIVQPTPDQVFFGSDAVVSVVAELQGTLRPDHSVVFFLNGNRRPAVGLSAEFSGLARGTYFFAPASSTRTATRWSRASRPLSTCARPRPESADTGARPRRNADAQADTQARARRPPADRPFLADARWRSLALRRLSLRDPRPPRHGHTRRRRALDSHLAQPGGSGPARYEPRERRSDARWRRSSWTAPRSRRSSRGAATAGSRSRFAVSGLRPPRAATRATRWTCR